MSIEVTKRPDFKKITDEMKRNVRIGMARAAEEEITEIRRRTARGYDVKGGQFPEYSKGYKRIRTEKGRALRPDLTFAGHMLRAMTSTIEVLADRITARLFFGSAREAAKASGNMKKRRFFALSKEQKKNITQTIKDALNGR